jgi:anaerobic C4-dicarboxylate transporter
MLENASHSPENHNRILINFPKQIVVGLYVAVSDNYFLPKFPCKLICL